MCCIEWSRGVVINTVGCYIPFSLLLIQLHRTVGVSFFVCYWGYSCYILLYLLWGYKTMLFFHCLVMILSLLLSSIFLFFFRSIHKFLTNFNYIHIYIFLIFMIKSNMSRLFFLTFNLFLVLPKPITTFCVCYWIVDDLSVDSLI